MDRCLLCKEEIRTIQGKIAVYLISRYLMVSDIAVLTASIHHYLCSEDICTKEYFGILDRTVYVRFCREVNDYIWRFLLEDLIDSFSVSDVSLIEHKLRILHSLS